MRTGQNIFDNCSVRRSAQASRVVDLLPRGPVVLFFDEWAADEDPSFKEFLPLHYPSRPEIQETVIVISHDDRYFAADHIVNLESGRFTNDVPALASHMAEPQNEVQPPADSNQ